MSRYPNRALIPILIGLAAGLVVSALFIETRPAFLGWLFGIGLGLMGGAFVAAITSGDSLVSGPAPRRREREAPWLDPPEDIGDASDAPDDAGTRDG